MGWMSGSSDMQTSTAVTEPWKAQQPYLTKGFERANSLYALGGPKYYTGQNWTDYSQTTDKSLDALLSRSRQGSPVMDASSRLITDTLSGKYLSPDSNPYLQDYYNQALQSSLPSLNATFSSAGRTGSDAQASALGDTYGALSRDIYGAAYDQERQRQMQAASLAPDIADQDYKDLQAQLGVGLMRDTKNTEKLQARMDRYNFNQQRPYDNLARYWQIVGNPGYGGTTTSSAPLQGGNPFGGALGGAATGAAMGSIIPGIGTGVGALGGGILGLLGSF